MKKIDYKIKPRLIYYVIGIHIIGLIILAFTGKSILPQKNKPLVVKNIIVKSEPKKVIVKPKAIQKKTAPKKIIKKKPKPTHKPQPKVQASNLSPSKDLLKQLEESISKIEKDTTVAPKVDKLDIPKVIKSLNIHAEVETISPTEQKYQQMLIQSLHENLKLPEYGEVRVSFTIKLDGTVSDIKILTHKSYKNQNYLKNALPDLTFPWFNQMANNEQNFTITFKNE